MKRKREEEEQEQLELQRKKEKLKQKKKQQEEQEENNDNSGEDLLPDKDEVISELRKLEAPVTLFGETDDDRYHRLQRIRRKIEQARKRKEREELEDSVDFNIVPTEVRDDRDKVCLQMCGYIRHLLREWEYVLNKRDEAGEQAYEILKQTRESLGPLLQQLRDQTLHEQIYPTLATLLTYMQQKNYRLAGDTYIKLSIGNATWPIGVAAVGIHARSARERITGEGNSADNVQLAHIMGDEKTRKWLTTIKRLITFAEANLR